MPDKLTRNASVHTSADGRMPGERMESSDNALAGLAISDMPRGSMTDAAGGMPGMPGAGAPTLAGLAISDMPRGGMTDVAGGMPGMTGAGASTLAGLAISDMPRGGMTDAAGGMPGMTGAGAPMLAGLAISDMPRGEMTGAATAEIGGGTSGGQEIKLGGEWRLSILLTGFKA